VKGAHLRVWKNLFQLVDQALDGDLVEVTHKGKTIRRVPDTQGSKLDRLTPIHIFKSAVRKKITGRPTANFLLKCSVLGKKIGPSFDLLLRYARSNLAGRR
jgi:hypothetical protein